LIYKLKRTKYEIGLQCLLYYLINKYRNMDFWPAIFDFKTMRPLRKEFGNSTTKGENKG